MHNIAGDKEFIKNAMQIAIPIAMQNLLVASFALVDTIMVGQLGDVALSAVGMAGQWTRFMNMAVFGIASGSVVFISQYWGSRDIDGIHRVTGIGVMLSLIVACILMLIGAIAPQAVIGLFNDEPQVIQKGAEYLRIAAFSYPAVALNLILSNALRTTEEVKLPLVVSGITALINAVFNYGLIFGKMGLPALGVKGAAVATCMSAWAAPILILILSYVRKNILAAPLKCFFAFGIHNIKAFFERALAVILNETAWGFSQMLFNIIFANLGYENYAALTIFRTFEEIAFVFFVGLCNASCVLVGKSIGAGDIERGKKQAKSFAVAVPLLALFEGALLIIFRHQLVRLFDFTNNLSDYTIRVAALLILIYALEMPVRNIPYIQIVGIFRPGGDTKTAMRYDLLSVFALSMPATAIAAYVLKLPFAAVFAIMFIFEDWVKAILCLKHFKSEKWIMPVTDVGKEALERYKRQKETGAKAD